MRAVFVGVDRHNDRGIRELIGAKRDALALSCLFQDSLPTLQAQTLVDADATLQRVEKALKDVLCSATKEDTVIVSFSGHGTRDHGLVCFDTESTNLGSSTLPMASLADWFRDSNARAIICVLDCCFSGAAPAKVLEEGAGARSGIGLQELAGEGRIIIAACNINESAYELPSRQQGLLTSVLTDLLQTENEGAGHDVLELAADLLKRVRAEAARLGYQQTPEILGSVKGGLSVPVLKAGPRYEQAFPEVGGVQVSGSFEELSAFGLPPAVLSSWESEFPLGLNELQKQAVNDHRVLDGESSIVIAPTSSGKTFVGELAALQAVNNGRKAVFLLPYKALTNEKFETFSRRYEDALDLRVIRVSGDYGDQATPFVKGQYDLAVLTYEMFLGLAVSSPRVLEQIGLVVLDEVQFITEPHRGIVVELILTQLGTARERGIEPQLIALGAVVKDVEPFAQWLECGLLLTHQRPVPLEEGVLDQAGDFHYRADDKEIQVESLVPPGEIWQRGKKASSQDLVIPLVSRLVAEGEKVLIFRNTRGATQGCANYLARDLGLPPATTALERLPTADLSGASESLRRALSGGTAFHNTNLTPEEKAEVEAVFRDPESPVRVLVATSGMAAGINTPADTVIVCETEFLGETGRPFLVGEYKNMAGRAGRLGFREKGRSVLLARHDIGRSGLINRYVLGHVEPLRSSFDASETDTWLIRLLALVREVPREDVLGLLANTFGGYLAASADPSWKTATMTRIEALLEKMIGLELIEDEQGTLSLTVLGRACGNSSLAFPSALRLVELLQGFKPEELTSQTLVLLLQCLREADATYTPLYKKNLSKEQKHVSSAAHRFGNKIVRRFGQRTRDNGDYYARAKRACIVQDWIDGVATDRIERHYSTTLYGGRVEYGNVRSIADTAKWLLPSVTQIASVVVPDRAFEIDDLQTRLQFGLPADVLPLLELPIELTRGEYLALASSGLTTPASMLEASPESLERILSRQNFERIKRHLRK